MRIELNTISNPKATYGKGTIFNDDNEPTFQFVTLELPWKNNKRAVSCIPPGPGGTKEYTVIKMKPTKKRPYEYFLVKDVEGRSAILWHPGNYTRQIKGCTLPGETHTDIDKDGIVDVTNTKHTLSILTSLMPDKFPLRITRK